MAGRLAVRRPADLGDGVGMQWAHRILDDAPASVPQPAQLRRPEVDAAIVDLPLDGRVATAGTMRLVFHPSADPAISMTALADLAEKIGTAAALATSLADLRREEHQRTALYGVALQLTGRAELRELLDLITKHARELLGAERAVACLADPRVDGHSVDWTDRLAIADNGSTCLLAHPADETGADRHNPACPVQHDGPRAEVLARPLHGADGFLGELCVMRSTGVPFTDRDRELLGALADMAAIAVGTARLREAEQQYTIVAERERIARELHDSIAQVLGVIHLRLRSLEPEVQDVPGNGVATEIGDLAEIADEAYKDVREAILGLRESVTSADGLEGALGEYLRKYSRQTGIKATLHCNGSARRALTPRSEIQLLRVVQEALTNVRKHAGARHATGEPQRRRRRGRARGQGRRERVRPGTPRGGARPRVRPGLHARAGRADRRYPRRAHRAGRGDPGRGSASARGAACRTRHRPCASCWLTTSRSSGRRSQVSSTPSST